MKKVFLMLAICATAAFVACESPDNDSVSDNKYTKQDNYIDPKTMTDEGIAEWGDILKENHPTTPEDFDTFLHALCNDLMFYGFHHRLVYVDGELVIGPNHEPQATGIADHSLQSTLLFFEDGTCWQCYNGWDADSRRYCQLEWTADRNTQTIKLVCPHFKEEGCKHAETELKLVAFGKHPFYGDNFYMVEGLQPFNIYHIGGLEDGIWDSWEFFAQYFIDATPYPLARANTIAEYKPHK